MKAVVHILVEIPFEISDHGYLGDTRSSIEDHMERARAEIARYKVFVQTNMNAEPVQVQARQRVEKVELLP